MICVNGRNPQGLNQVNVLSWRPCQLKGLMMEMFMVFINSYCNLYITAAHLDLGSFSCVLL